MPLVVVGPLAAMLTKQWFKGGSAAPHAPPPPWIRPCTRKHTSSYTVALYTAVLGEVTVCLCPQGGWTALHLAALGGKIDVVRLLTEAQALVNIQTEVHTLCHV